MFFLTQKLSTFSDARFRVKKKSSIRKRKEGRKNLVKDSKDDKRWEMGEKKARFLVLFVDHFNYIFRK